MTKNLWYFVAAAVLATVGFLAVAHFEGANVEKQFQARRAGAVAASVAWAASQEYTREDDDAEGLAQRFVAAVDEELPTVRKALVLKKTKFLAHTDPERAGGRLSRDSLADKALYDLGRKLDAQVGKNIEERERNPDLKRDAYVETNLERRDGLLVASAPAKVDGEFEALAQVEVEPVPFAPSFPVTLLAWALGAIVLFAAAGARLKRGAAVAVGAGLLVTMVALEAHTLLDWRDALRRDVASTMSSTYARLGIAGLLALGGDESRPELITTLEKTGPKMLAAMREKQQLMPAFPPDPARKEIQELVDIRSSTAAAAAPPDSLKFDEAGYSVFYAEAFFQQARSTDAGHMTEWGVALAILALLVFILGAFGQILRAWLSLIRHRFAYAYMSPAMLGMLVLVFIPVVYGIILGFARRQYNVLEFSGLSNYAAILSNVDMSDPQNFYFTLGVTMMWTFTNVFLHVTIGLFLALLLNDQMLKAKGVYRVLLIVPWAVPNYITALIWKGMFHKQFGAVNGFLELLGFEPMSWFQTFWPSFFTNLATNTWLGFPFMMVVSLGALQSIPTDLYEAAIVDGASRWQRFKSITLPLLMPALVPAVMVGTVWTFNMFNIIYLVSGGAPNGATDILITEAFRWAFERDRYGYAAAYSTLIFIILILITLTTNRITGATKGAYE